jgi:membrane-associated protein
MFESVMTSIGKAVGLWMYVIAGGLAFSEAAILVGFVLPGEIALLVAGYFCRFGHLNLSLMVVIAIVSAIAGDSVGFEFGRKFGPGLRRSRVGHWIGERRWSAVDAFLHKHGGKAVFLGRLVALMRALMPSMAGMSRMKYRTFLMWNAAGGIIWGGGCVILGYAFASAIKKIGDYLTYAPLIILGLAVATYVALHMRKRRRERAEGESYAAADATSND